MFAPTTSNEIPRGVVNNNWDGSSSNNNNDARAPAYPVAFGGPYDADYESFYATNDSAANAAALDAEETSPNAGVITAATSSSAAVAAGSFPQKLHRMLCDAPSAGFEDVCAWVVNGTAFRIHDPQRFVEEVMPRYFSQQTKYKSFQRMLNIYNFLRVPHGPNKGCYAHKNFVRSQPHLAATIQRYNHKAWKRNRQERLRQLQLQQQQAQQSGAIVTPPYARPVVAHHLKQHSFSSSMLYTDEVLNDAASAAAAAAMAAEGQGGNPPSGHGRPGFHHQHNRTLSMDLFRDLEMDSILKDVVFDGTGANGAISAGGGHQNRHHPTFSSMSFFSVSSGIDADDPDRINHDLNGVLDLFQENEYAHNTHDNNNTNYCSSTSSSSSTMDDELREYEQQMDERFFPIKLYDMLEAAENNEHVMSEDGNPVMMKSIISWLHDGTAFKVLDTKAFTKYIMPLYFDQTQYESFRRQLNMYGFIREPRGINRGTYHHPSFRRGYRQECRNNIFRRASGSGGAGGAISKKNNTESPVPNVTTAAAQSAW